MPVSPVPKRRFLRGWRSLIFVILALALFVWLDGLKKNAGQGVGYCPEDAAWLAAAEDFGAVWEGMAETQSIASLREEWPRPLASWELAVRQLTGVRPTPSRWRLWMGYRALAADAPEGRGICVYPGLLIRGLHLILRPISGGDDAGVFTFGELRYGWRDGFLIVSDSAEYVKASLAAPEPAVEPSTGPNELRFHWRGQPEGFFRVRCEEGFPIEGRARLAVTPRSGPLTLADAWPGSPLFTVTAAKGGDIRAVLRLATEPFRDVQGWSYLDRSARAVWQAWGFDTLPEGWDRPIDHCSVAVMDVDSTTALPIPRVALALRCARPPRGAQHPLGSLVKDFTTYPHEWQEREGLLAPLAGDQLTLCLCRDGLDWLGTSDEPLMNDLLGSFEQKPAPDCDMAVRLNWEKFGAAVGQQLAKAAELELIPRMNADDVRYELLPIVRGLSRLGTLAIDARAEGDSLVFNGFLAKTTGEAAQ